MTNNDTSRIPLIPREILFGNPDKASPQVSPDGKLMAYLAPHDDVLNVWVGTVGQDDYRPVTNDTDRGIRVYFWAHNGRQVLYLQDEAGNENWRLYSVDISTGKTTEHTPFDDVQVQILEHDKHFPDDVLLAINKDDARFHDVYHLNLRSHELTQVAKNPGNVTAWLVDAELAVRGATAATAAGGFDFLIRDSRDDEWRTLVSWSAEDALTSAALGFTRDGGSVYLLDSRDANAARLVKLHIGTRETRVLAEDPTYDVAGAMIHPDTREIQMVSFLKARTEHVVLDPSIEDDIAAIQLLNPGDFDVINRNHADDVWLVAFIEDNQPISYYSFDRKTREGTFLFHNRSALAEYTLAESRPVAFQARDGLTIHGYLHLPADGKGGARPMVLNVHGGPWHRDTWGYDPEAQWFANRGYACLQLNFRGSTGYGKRVLNAGDKEWGGKMHDDLVDGVRWAVESGYADPNRIAIYGGSYGGYAALVGATFTPQLFTCAVDIVGPSNLITFINTIPPYWSSYLTLLHQRVGNPETEAEFLKSRSPLFHVDKIQIPMLIAQGANDPRVKQAESEQIVEAMKSKGIDHSYMLFEDEGHGFAKPENRLEFYAAAEKFLAKHLNGKVENGGAS